MFDLRAISDYIARNRLRPASAVVMVNHPGAYYPSIMEIRLSQLNLSRPFWADYRPALQQLKGTGFPTAKELSALLPAGLQSHGGRPVRFVPASEIPDVVYEPHIFQTGQISTRTDNWHDLFNALVWSRFPRLKSAMNALHVAQHNEGRTAKRGRLRDALTLLDESGAIVVSDDPNLLNSVARHDWPTVFGTGFSGKPEIIEPGALSIFLCGHALLEKFLQPYKSMTAKALLVAVDNSSCSLPREQLLKRLDQVLASALLEDRLFNSPADLAPLPLMGIPGWWPNGQQDAAFYADPAVFRPPRSASNPAPVFSIAL